jgi:hypothetical protein
MATADLEQQYRMFCGTFANLGLHFSWILQAAADCAENCGWPLEHCDILREAARCLPRGFCAGAGHLVSLDVDGLSRNFAQDLIRRGYESIQSLATSTTGELSALLPADLSVAIISRAKAIVAAEASSSHLSPEWFDVHSFPRACVQDIIPAERMPSKITTADAPQRREAESSQISETAGFYPDHLESCSSRPLDVASFSKVRETLDLTETQRPDLAFEYHHPGQVIFRGKRVRLTPKPYALLKMLAHNPNRTLSYSEIDQEVWPGEKVESQQISAHKSTLVRKLSEICGPEEARTLVQTDARFGLRLNLEARRICLAARF